MASGRMHVRVPLALKAWVEAYACRKNTTITALVLRFLTELRQAEEAKEKTEVDQV